MSYVKIMERCLARVPDTLDKREGSIIYDALAPAAAELASAYMFLSAEIDRAFIDTAAGADLENKAKERGIERIPASNAVRLGVFTDPSGSPMEIPLGSRFSGDNYNFAATGRTAAGQYALTAEEPGSGPNAYTGILFPIDQIENLGSATLTELLIPGEDAETDEALRARFYASIDSQAFGGNILDYKQKVEPMQGVGMVKVFPVWNGGGTVKLVLVDSEGGVPSSTLISAVQQAVDPQDQSGSGYGIAPIGHKVTVAAAREKQVDISLKIAPAAGLTVSQLKPELQAALESYLHTLTAGWAEEKQLVVRVSRIESCVLDLDGVLDVSDTKLCNNAENLTLAEDEIPVLGVLDIASA